MKSNSDIRTIALIEVGGSHDECLLTQMHALKSEGIRLVMVCTPEIKERNPAFDAYIDDYHFTYFVGSGRKDFAVMRRALNYLLEQGVDTAILNTAQGSHVRNLCWMARRKPIEFIGIIHTTRKFQGSFTQKRINKKIKKYLLLSEYLLSTITPPKGITVDYFYPIRFPKQEWNIPRSEKLEVTIIGGVENRRKDLSGFVEMIKDVPASIHFTFLGKSDRNKEEVNVFIAALEANGLSERVSWYEGFVSQEDFDAHLQHSDLILPLVHPDTPSADQYFRNQISGAMSVAFGYKIPMLIHSAYAHIEEMNTAGFYYTQDDFQAVLQKAQTELEAKRKAMNDHQPYQVDFQEQRYRTFVLGS